MANVSYLDMTDETGSLSSSHGRRREREKKHLLVKLQ